MIITGYHGTSEKCADEIIASKKYELSNGDEEWLGSGIYFYEQYIDAWKWTRQRKYNKPSILHSIIKVRKDEVIDFDTEEGKRKEETFKKICAKFNMQTKSKIKNQCALMNYIWQKCDDIKVLISSFAIDKTTMGTLHDGRIRRREFCVRNNDAIISTVKMEVI